VGDFHPLLYAGLSRRFHYVPLSGLVKNVKQMTAKQRKYMELKQLLHDIEITNLQIKASEEKTEILEEYGCLMEKLIKDTPEND